MFPSGIGMMCHQNEHRAWPTTFCAFSLLCTSSYAIIRTLFSIEFYDNIRRSASYLTGVYIGSANSLFMQRNGPEPASPLICFLPNRRVCSPSSFRSLEIVLVYVFQRRGSLSKTFGPGALDYSVQWHMIQPSESLFVFIPSLRI
ncbi:hypothetical protein C8J55DRAFT_312645 [Lentinula edodes]|uniref:Uncharacterized protein n=1 Tax=Lentinula lateritia TaxID=40482 RepID=A0A9W9DXC5_9AGAR|nr:hypothetical protein C8J55DRAFT_312645 [Lentinula edodes]